MFSVFPHCLSKLTHVKTLFKNEFTHQSELESNEYCNIRQKDRLGQGEGELRLRSEKEE